MKRKRLILIVFVVAIIVFIISFSFAYFTSSDNSEEFIVKSYNISLSFDEDRSDQTKGLIPSSEEVAIWAYKNGESYNGLCKDDNYHDVCSVYKFTVTNTSELGLYAGALWYVSYNGFQHLYYNLYEISYDEDGNKIYNLIRSDIAPEGNVASVTYKDYWLFGDPDDDDMKQYYESGETKNYELVFWIKNYDYSQALDIDKTFSGYLKIIMSDKNHMVDYRG